MLPLKPRFSFARKGTPVCLVNLGAWHTTSWDAVVPWCFDGIHMDFPRETIKMGFTSLHSIWIYMGLMWDLYEIYITNFMGIGKPKKIALSFTALKSPPAERLRHQQTKEPRQSSSATEEVSGLQWDEMGEFLGNPKNYI